MMSAWRKARASVGNGSCVEIRRADKIMLMRDTKDQERGPLLIFTAEAFEIFARAVKAGEFDDLV